MKLAICAPFMESDLWQERLRRAAPWAALEFDEFYRPEEIRSVPGFRYDAGVVAGDEEDVCLGAGAGGAYLLLCAGAVGVGAVAGHLLEVRFRQLLQDGGMRTLAVVVLKIQH